MGVGVFFGSKYFMKEETVKTITEKQSVNADTPKEEGKPPTDEEMFKILTGLYSDVVETVYDLGDEHGWIRGDNPPDYEALKEGLDPYITDHFAKAQLKEMLDDLYCQCDMTVFPSPDFEGRFKIVESEADYFKVRSFEFMNEMGTGGVHIFFTVYKEDEEWKFNSFKTYSYSDKPLNVTKEEANQYMKENYPSAQYIKAAMLESDIGYDFDNEKYIYGPVKSYLYYVEDENKVYGVASNSGGFIYDVPLNLIPQFTKGDNESGY